MNRRRLTVLLSHVALSLCAQQAKTQTTPGAGPSLSAVVDEARSRYPSVRVSQEEVNASAARLALARSAYLPRLDGSVQFNRGTRNNVFGSLLPQAVIPPMSGPVIGSNNGGSVWGSAAGFLASWQPFDFGLRHANVMAAEAAHERTRATSQRTELEVAAAAADGYLTELASISTRSATVVAVESWDTLRTSIHALVAAQLRPGADESRVEAERAAAVNQLAMAEEAIEASRATRLRFAPQSGAGAPSPRRLLAELPDLSAVDASFVSAQNPAAAEQEAASRQSAAQLHAIERSWVPQFNLEVATYARGTGADSSGRRLAGANGLASNVGNYVAGVNITFPFLDFVSVHARESEQAANLRAAKASQDLTLRTLQEQFSQALAAVKSAMTIAENTPVQLRAAQAAFDQATARYKAGLAPIDDLAQAQRLLVQAKIDNSISRLNVWRAFLRLQFVRGDLQPFLDQAGR